MANAIVIIATLGLSILPVKDIVFPPAPSDQVTNIRIGAGSNKNNDGSIPGVHLFDFEGKTIGIAKSNGDKIQKGLDHDISVNHRLLADNAAAQAEYISVVQGGNDALCISYITAVLPNGVQYSWNGDIGFQCGALWMFGNTTLTADAAGGIYQPRCNWIDGDNSDGLHTKAMGIHLPSFLANQGRVDQYDKDNDVMCKADPRFKLYDQLDVEDAIPHFKDVPFNGTTLIDFNRDTTLDPANWATTPVDKTPLKGIESEKRGLNQRGNHTTNTGNHKNIDTNKRSGNRTTTAPTQSSKHQGQLIKSGSQYHSASELCGSATSYGPDFVSIHEGIFCDMDQKKAWPLCKTAKDTACFDDKTNKMRLGAANSRRDGKGTVLPRKVYKNIEQW